MLYYGKYNNGACSFSGSSAAVKSSERKPLPLKTGSCLEILTPYKPVVDDKTAKEDPPSKPSLPSNVRVYVCICTDNLFVIQLIMIFLYIKTSTCSL